MKPKVSLGVILSVWLVAAAAFAGPNDIQDQGVGLYTDPSVANLVSTFTINRRMVSCGVGSSKDSFTMLMYSKDVQSYRLDRVAGTIRATGRMRSITRVGEDTEDVDHDFLAIAVDGSPDRFDIHFTTPFWTTMNPLCTHSTVVPGACNFGGDVFSGDVTVHP